MNLWECQHPGCKSTAVGVGGAAGLIAIGWYFRPGPELLCPRHRPDPEPCVDWPENYGKPCRLCAGERVARSWQKLINRESGYWTPQNPHPPPDGEPPSE